MSAFYEKMAKVADRLISKFGKTEVDYFHVIEKGEDWDKALFVEEHKVNLIILPSDKYSKEVLRLNSSFNIVDSDNLVFMSDVDFKPSLSDYFVLNGKKYTIINVVNIEPDGQTNVVYKLGVK